MRRHLMELTLLVRALPHMLRVSSRRQDHRLEITWFAGVPDDVVHLIAHYDPEDHPDDWMILAARREQERRFPEWFGRPASAATRRYP